MMMNHHMLPSNMQALLQECLRICENLHSRQCLHTINEIVSKLCEVKIFGKISPGCKDNDHSPHSHRSILCGMGMNQYTLLLHERSLICTRYHCYNLR